MRFARQHARLVQGIDVLNGPFGDGTAIAVTRTHQAVRVGILLVAWDIPVDTGRLAVTVTAPALIESPALRAAVRGVLALDRTHSARQRKKLTLAFSIAVTDAGNIRVVIPFHATIRWAREQREPWQRVPRPGRNAAPGDARRRVRYAGSVR